VVAAVEQDQRLLREGEAPAVVEGVLMVIVEVVMVMLVEMVVVMLQVKILVAAGGSQRVAEVAERLVVIERVVEASVVVLKALEAVEMMGPMWASRAEEQTKEGKAGTRLEVQQRSLVVLEEVLQLEEQQLETWLVRWIYQ
jgi:hypothetical protein